VSTESAGHGANAEPPTPPSEPGEAGATPPAQPSGIKKYEVGEAAPRVKKEEKTPREAKIAFAVGIVLILGLVALSLVGIFGRSTPDKSAAVNTPAPVAPPPAPPRPSGGNDGGGGGAGGGGAGSGDSDPDETVSAPMSRPAYRTLKGLWRFFFENSHLKLGKDFVPARECLPEGALEGAPGDVPTNLKLADLRVDQMPLVGMRILSESPTPGGSRFEYELIARTATGDLVARGAIQLAASGAKFMSVSKFDALGTFDAPDSGPTAAPPAPPSPAAPPGAVATPKDGAAPSAEHRGYPYMFQ
jgi:hypothetical protein